MRVPVFNNQVNEAQTPSVRVSGGLTPGQAVDAVSNRTDGLVGMVNAGAQAFQQYQDEADRVRVMDAQNQLAELKIHLQNNQTDGFNHKKGVDVVSFDDGQGGGFVDYYSNAFQEGVSQINSKLGNNRQRQMFNQIAARDTIAFKSSIQNYFVNENDTYQKSVYSASADRFVRNINENPADFKSIDENRLSLRAALNKVAQLQGKSALEAENMYLGTISQTHVGNINSFIENNDLRGAVQYRNKYADEISLNDSFKANKWIQQKLEEKQVESLVNSASEGVEYGSNYALNIPVQATQQAVNELKGLTSEQMKNIKYNDQRLDIYTVHAAKEKGMEWAAPLLLGLRLSGEKSNNNQVSPKGAKSVMQFMPATWGEFNNDGKRDINNPAHTIDAALEFVDWISKKYKTKDPMVIAAYYNGGGKAAEAVLNGKQPPATETRNYLQRIDKWLTVDFGKYADEPAKSRQQAFDVVWNSDAPPEVKSKAQTVLNQKFSAMDKVKSDQQDQVYNNLYKGIVSGQMTFDQIPVNAFDVLKPNQIKDLQSVSKSIFEKPVKTDNDVFSMIMLNKQELFKGKPQSVLHQFADKLSPSDYRQVTNMYIEVNKAAKDVKKDDLLDVTPNSVSDALSPYLPMLGITDKSNKKQIEHYSAVQSDMMQALMEAQASNGGKLNRNQFNRIVLKNIGIKSRITDSRQVFGMTLPGTESITTNRIYAVKSKDDIAPNTQKKIDDIFKKQGRDLAKVTLAEYLNAYYSVMRRGF